MLCKVSGTSKNLKISNRLVKINCFICVIENIYTSNLDTTAGIKMLCLTLLKKSTQ